MLFNIFESKSSAEETKMDLRNVTFNTSKKLQFLNYKMGDDINYALERSIKLRNRTYQKC